MANLFAVGDDQYRVIDKRIAEIKRQLNQKDGSPLDPDLVIKTLQDIINRENLKKRYLKLISADKEIIIDQCDGSKVIDDTEDVFKYIESDFHKWEADEKGPATGETLVGVHEMIQSGTLSEVFSSISSDMSKLCFTQSQIISFVQNHRSWLKTDESGTFFLFKSKGGLLVACVYFISDGVLGIIVLGITDDSPWSVEPRHRFVIPQLTP